MDALNILPPGCLSQRVDAPFHVWEADGSDWVRFYRDATSIQMQFPELAEFYLSEDGKVVRCKPAKTTDQPTLDHLYQNQVWPMVLSLRGKRVYHGASFEHDGAAIALLGATGRGKSSLLASFASAGFRFLNDDLLVLEPDGAGFRVLPGAPSLRLWPDARAAIVGKACEIKQPVSYTIKERISAGLKLEHRDQPLPLKAAIFLSIETSNMSPNPLFGSDALAAWMENVFVLEVDRPETVQSAFARTAEIARNVPAIALTYPRDYDALPEVRRMILNEVDAHHEAGAVL